MLVKKGHETCKILFFLKSASTKSKNNMSMKDASFKMMKDRSK